MDSIYTMLENCRKAYESMTDPELVEAMEQHMHLEVDPVEDGLVNRRGQLVDRDAAIRELLQAEERELRLLGFD